MGSNQVDFGGITVPGIATLSGDPLLPEPASERATGQFDPLEPNEDFTQWTVTLRNGVTFHDGTTFDADDVVFSLDRARAEDSTNAQKALFAGIESVEVVDPLTVKVTLKEANGSFPFNMAWGDAVIVAP